MSKHLTVCVCETDLDCMAKAISISNALYDLGHNVEVRTSAAPVVLTADGLEWRFIAADHGPRALGKARGFVADHMIVTGSVETCSDEWEALAATLGGRR